MVDNSQGYISSSGKLVKPSDQAPSSLQGIFTPKKADLSVVKEQVESGQINQPLSSTPREVQRGYSSNIRYTPRVQSPQAIEVAEQATNVINKQVGGQQLIQYSPLGSAVLVSQNPLTTQSPGVMNYLGKQLASSDVIGIETNKGYILISNVPLQSSAQPKSTSLYTPRESVTPSSDSIAAQLIYGEAARNVGSQAVNLYSSINPKDIKTTTGKLYYEAQRPFIQAERQVIKLEESPNIIENIGGGLARLGLGVAETVTAVPYSLVYGGGQLAETKVLNIKPSEEDVKVTGTGLGLSASGIASAYKLGQDVGTYLVVAPVGLSANVLTGASIGLGSSTVAESSNIISGKKARPERIVSQTALGAVGGLVDTGLEVAAPRIGKVISESKVGKDISKAIGEYRVKTADVSVDSNQFITKLSDTDAYSRTLGTFESKSLGIKGDISGSTSSRVIPSGDIVGVGQTQTAFVKDKVKVKSVEPLEFRQTLIPGGDTSAIQGSFISGGKEGIYTTAISTPNRPTEIFEYATTNPPKEFAESFIIGKRQGPLEVNPNVAYKFDISIGKIASTIPSDQPILAIGKGKKGLYEIPVSNVLEGFTKAETTTGGDIFQNIQRGLIEASGERGLFIGKGEPFTKTGQASSSKTTIYLLEGDIRKEIVPVVGQKGLSGYKDITKDLEIKLESNVPKDVFGERRLGGSAGGQGRVRTRGNNIEIFEDLTDNTYGVSYKSDSRFVSPDRPIFETQVRKSLTENIGLFEPKLVIPSLKGIGLAVGLAPKSGFKLPTRSADGNIGKNKVSYLPSAGQSIGLPTALVDAPVSDYIPPSKVESPLKSVDDYASSNKNVYQDSSRFDFNINLPPIGLGTIGSPFLGLPFLGSGGGGSEGARGKKTITRGEVRDLLSVARRGRLL